MELVILLLTSEILLVWEKRPTEDEGFRNWGAWSRSAHYRGQHCPTTISVSKAVLIWNTLYSSKSIQKRRDEVPLPLQSSKGRVELSGEISWGTSFIQISILEAFLSPLLFLWVSGEICCVKMDCFTFYCFTVNLHLKLWYLCNSHLTFISITSYQSISNYFFVGLFVPVICSCIA